MAGVVIQALDVIGNAVVLFGALCLFFVFVSVAGNATGLATKTVQEWFSK